MIFGHVVKVKWVADYSHFFILDGDKFSYFWLSKKHKMRFIIISSMLTIFLFSCNSEPKAVHLRTVKGKRVAVAKVNANRLLTVEVEGMSCEMACGGSLRMNLKATGAIDRVKFDFTDGRKIQTASIAYDDTQITETEILKLIENMNEHQFKTHKHSTEELKITTHALPPSVDRR